MSTRVNARIDDELSLALERYRKRTDQTVTEVLERALERFLGTEGKERSPAQAFSSTGFIGVAKGPVARARSAKKHATASPGRKR